jgi:hypothetical protein
MGSRRPKTDAVCACDAFRSHQDKRGQQVVSLLVVISGLILEDRSSRASLPHANS